MKKVRDVNSEKSSPAYQIWPGKNIFLCKGKLIVGSEYKRAIISFCLIFIPELLFLGTCGRYYAETPIIIVGSFLISCISLLFHFLVSTRDPGYIPKQLPPFAKGPFGAPTLLTACIKDSSKPCAIDTSYFEYPINGRLVKIKYCPTCNIKLGLLLRPPRASHCADCGLCVEKFDHHCPWVGNCIGKRNYRIYLGFLISTSTLIAFNLIFSISEVKNVAEEISKHEKNGDKVFYKLLEGSGGTIVFLLYTFIVRFYLDHVVRVFFNFFS